MEYTFRQAEIGEIDAVFSLFEKRIQWMDDKGIRQWNATDYLNIYPKSYYEEQRRLGNLYVLVGDKITGAVVLLESDERWSDRADDPAFYVHNLVTDVAAKGAGRQMLAEAEKLAKSRGKGYVRLDCAVESEFLNGYYESLGYKLAGECRDGGYVGNRREKKL